MYARETWHMKCRARIAGRRTFRWLWLVLAFVWLNPISAWALDPSRYLSQYAHTAWRIQDGFFNSSPIAVVQTQTGYLWIGTISGLLSRVSNTRLPRIHASHNLDVGLFRDTFLAVTQPNLY